MSLPNVQHSAVKDKIPAIMKCVHIANTNNTKPGCQHKVKFLATIDLNYDLYKKLINNMSYKATIKVHGSCCLIAKDKTGKVRLLKRRDIKSSNQKIPETWIETGTSSNNHRIGFMPLETTDKWEYDVHPVRNDAKINAKGEQLYDTSKIRVLTLSDNHKTLVYDYVDITTLENKSVELLGPKIQGNSHKLKYHCVIVHGLLIASNFPNLHKIALENKNKMGNIINDNKLNTDYLVSDNPFEQPEWLVNWMKTDPQAEYAEGVVIHMEDGTMYKIHRHHLNIKWKMEKPLIMYPI